jgi:hypothetical protein
MSQGSTDPFFVPLPGVVSGQAASSPVFGIYFYRPIIDDFQAGKVCLVVTLCRREPLSGRVFRSTESSGLGGPIRLG